MLTLRTLIIGDGDSSVTKKLNDVMPYGSNVLIEKIECRNHILCNYRQKLLSIKYLKKEIVKEIERCGLFIDNSIPYL